MTIILNNIERILLLGMLPQKGNYNFLNTIRSISTILATTEEERKECNIRIEDGQLRWDKDIDKEIDFSSEQFSIIVDVLKKVNKEDELPIAGMSLFEKFGCTSKE